MKLSDTDALLGVAPLPLETGYERLDDGVLHVACRTDMRHCSGAMFEWWFRSRPGNERYVWWHPIDHIASHWIDGSGDTHLGSIHLAEERFTGLAAQKVAIQMREPTEFFARDLYRAARDSAAVSAAVCARIAESHTPARDADGCGLGGRLLHIGRDTDWGLVLRSHFFLGQDLPAAGMSAQQIGRIFSDEFARALLQHCYNEFTFLSRFLPSLYGAENRETVSVPLPW